MAKNRIFLVVLVLALLVGGFFAFRGNNSEEYVDDEPSTSLKAEAGEIEVLGVISCLPYSRGSSDADCVKALKGDDGKTYALNSVKVDGIERTMPEGTEVLAIGVFEPANTTIDESSAFSYDGVLVVRILKRR